MAVIVALPLGKLFLAYTPIPQKYKSWYRAAIFVVIGVFFLFIYFGGKDTYFDPTTGKPLKYYSISPIGQYKFYSQPGFDPETGDSLRPVTKDVILKSKGVKPKEVPKIIYQPPPPEPKPPPVEAKKEEPQKTPQKKKKFSDVPRERKFPDVPKERSNHSIQPEPLSSAPNYNPPNQGANKKVPDYSEVISQKKTTETPNYNFGEGNFQNQTNSTVFILTSSNRIILQIEPRETAVLTMPAGKYFYQFSGQSVRGSFDIPARTVYYLTFQQTINKTKRVNVIRNVGQPVKYTAPSRRPVRTYFK